MKKSVFTLMLSVGLISTAFISCEKKTTSPVGKDITTATKVSVDRFSDAAATLMKRNATNGLPAANAAIDLDKEPFITVGLDKTGTSVTYYNFDVQSTTPDDIYVFFKKGSTTPVPGQNNILATIPGDDGYNDFWVVNKVTAPDDYVANSITSEAEVMASGYAIEKTTTIVNCPVVPFGSTAKKSKTAGMASVSTIGWYKGQAVNYFSFEEAKITAKADGKVPVSPIYVQFNVDANLPNGGPASGFKTEMGTSQTHNVIATSPGDLTYSPLWSVQAISNTHFMSVSNLTTAQAASPMAAGMLVNCPVVK